MCSYVKVITRCHLRETVTNGTSLHMSRAPIVCSEGLIKCQTRNRCISVNQVCDGVNDCIDNTDEPEECGKAVVNFFVHVVLLCSRSFNSCHIKRRLVKQLPTFCLSENLDPRQVQTNRATLIKTWQN
jgi:hypothetical protein